MTDDSLAAIKQSLTEFLPQVRDYCEQLKIEYNEGRIPFKSLEEVRIRLEALEMAVEPFLKKGELM